MTWAERLFESQGVWAVAGLLVSAWVTPSVAARLERRRDERAASREAQAVRRALDESRRERGRLAYSGLASASAAFVLAADEVVAQLKLYGHDYESPVQDAHKALREAAAEVTRAVYEVAPIADAAAQSQLNQMREMAAEVVATVVGQRTKADADTAPIDAYRATEFGNLRAVYEAIARSADDA